MPDVEQNLVDLVQTIVEPLVEVPDELEITSSADEASILIEIRVNADDAGKVIGR